MLAQKTYHTGSGRDPPSHLAFQVWCFSHVCFWSYSLSKVKFGYSYVRQILCIIGRRPVLLLWGNSRRVFGNIGKPHDPAVTCPILVLVAASSTERCRWMSRCLSEHLPLNVMLLRNMMLYWTGSGRTAVSREPCNV